MCLVVLVVAAPIMVVWGVAESIAPPREPGRVMFASGLFSGFGRS